MKTHPTTVVKMLFGSHLYGLNTPASDTDYKAIELPTGRDVLLQRANYSRSESTGDDSSRNSSDDVDFEVFSFQRFVELASKGETVAIDMLHAPQSAIVESSETWKSLVANREMFYTKNMKAYIGYVRKQAAKYSVKGSRLAVLEQVISMVELFDGMVTPSVGTVGDIITSLPQNEYAAVVHTNDSKVGPQVFYEICGRKFQTTLKLPMFVDALRRVYDSYGERAQLAKSNTGIDWKAISHALRAGYQARAIYKEGGFTYPLKETAYLLDVKTGKLDYVTQVQNELESLVDEVLDLADKSAYPDKVEQSVVDNWVASVHNDIVTA